MKTMRVFPKARISSSSGLGRWAGILSFGLGILLCAQPVSGQTSLADYDYENLDFRGFSLQAGYIWPNTVEPTYSIGTRIDLGYLGPGFRLVPGFSYWSSEMSASEVQRFERNLDDLIGDQLDPGSEFEGVDLGTVDMSDFIISMDGHFVWAVPFNFLTYLGTGLSLHFMNGDGDAIAGTFVEDNLDTVKPALNFHGGLEYPLANYFRLYGDARWELLEDLQYWELRLGGQIMLTLPAPGETRSP